MASHWRASQSSLPNYGANNGPNPVHLGEPLDVAPLSSVPYTGPPPPFRHPPTTPVETKAASVSVEANTTSSKHNSSQPPAGSQPAMIFFTAPPAREELDNLISSANGGVALTGSALLGKVGHPIGSVDIGESEDEYVFRVSLPGVARDEKIFRCELEPSGQIIIQGVTVTGENLVCRDKMVFKMQTQNLCPSGEFSVSFQLPGPIVHGHLAGAFGSDGIFEGVVRKANRPF